MFRKIEDFSEEFYLRQNEKISLTGPENRKFSVLFAIEDVY